MLCKNCGKEIPSDARFCKYCGVAIQPTKLIVQQKRKIPKYAIPALVAVVILAVVIGAFIHFSNVNRPSAVFLHQLDSILTGEDDEVEESTTDTEEMVGQLEAIILKNVSYEVLAQERDRLVLRISAPDMGKIISSNGQTVLSQPNAIQSILTTMESGNFEYLETELEIEIVEDGSPSDPYALMDALYGNMFSQMTVLLEAALAEGA